MSAKDLLVLVGVASLGTGLALWSLPLMLVVLGTLFLLGGLWSHYSDPGPPLPPPEVGDELPAP